MFGILAWCLSVTPRRRRTPSSAVCDFFVWSWGPFPPIRWSVLASSWVVLPCLIASLFLSYFIVVPWKQIFSEAKMKGRSSAREKRWWGFWRNGGTGNYCWNVLNEKRIIFYFKKFKGIINFVQISCLNRDSASKRNTMCCRIVCQLF